MESYHEVDSLSSSGYPDTPVRNAPRRLGPFEYIATPPIQHLLDAITRHMRPGGSFAPGVRQLSEMSGVTLGLISGILYELDRTGWISYNGHVIMLLRDQSDHETTVAPFEALGSLDQNLDRFDQHMVLAAASTCDSESAAAVMGGCGGADQPPDHAPPDHRALLLSELGAAPKIIAKALEARPDLTTEQIRASWSHFQPRIAAGLCGVGAFCAAMAIGQLHAAPPDPARPLDPAAYAADPAFRLGGDTTGLDAPPTDFAAVQPPPPPEVGRSIRDRALDLLPGKWTGENHAAMVRDSCFLQGRLSRGDSDQEALAALDAYRKAVRR